MTDEQGPIVKPEEEASEADFRAALKAAQEAAQSAMEGAVAGSVSTMQALDSLQGNEFHVEINGEKITGVFRVDGLTTISLTENGMEKPPIVLAKMVQRDATIPFNRWLRESVGVGDSDQRPTRTLDVVAVDDGEETRRWSLRGAYITSVSYNTFDTSSSDMVEEVVTIAYAAMSEQWTWSDAQ
jgi:hypothetical protein